MLHGYTIEGKLVPSLVRVELVPYFPDFEYTRFDFVLNLKDSSNVVIEYSRVSTAYVADLLRILDSMEGNTSGRCLTDKAGNVILTDRQRVGIDDSCKKVNSDRVVCQKCANLGNCWKPVIDLVAEVKSCSTCIDYNHFSSCVVNTCGVCRDNSKWRGKQ